MSTVVVELTGDEANLLRSLDKVIAKERDHERQLAETAARGDKAGAELAGAFDKASRTTDKALQGILKDLSRVGPAGREMAAGLKTEFQKAGKGGHKSIQSILDELQKLDPEAAEQARQIAASMKQAASSSTRSFDRLAEPIEHAGLTAEEVSQRLRESFGQASEGILPELGKITDSVGGIGGSLFAMAGAGGAISAVVGGFQAVSGAIVDNKQKLIDVRDAALEVAEAQQNASANLVGMSIVDQNEVLSERLPELAAELGVRDLAGFKAAYGAAYSASGGDADYAERAVTAAASVSSADAGGIRANSAAALDLQRATGIVDAERNLALLGTARAVARVDDPESFANTLAKAVSLNVATIPEQDRESAAVQTAAFFSTATQFGTDVTGEESKTASIQFGKKIDELFDTLPDIAMEARDKLTKLVDANTLSPTQSLQLRELEAKKAERPDKFSAEDAANLQQLNERTEFTELELKQRDHLESLIAEIQQTVDPQNFAKRISTIQQSPALAEELFSQDIGGEVFSGVFKQIRDAESQFSKAFFENIEKVSTDRSAFEQQALAAMAGTPAMLTAFLKRSGEAAKNVAELGQPGDAMRVQLEQNVENALAVTRGEGLLASTNDYFGELWRWDTLPGKHALTKSQSSVLPLIERREELVDQNEASGGDPDLEAKIKSLELLIDAHQKATGAYVQQIVDGRVKPRPGEIAEAQRFNRMRLAYSQRPGAANELGTEFGREIVQEQAEQLRPLQGDAASQQAGTAPQATAEQVPSMAKLFDALERRSGLAADGITAEEKPRFSELNDQIRGMRDLIIEQVPSLDNDARRLLGDQVDAFGRKSGPLFTADKAGQPQAFDQAYFFNSLLGEFRRQSAAVEKQNELLEKQNAAAERSAAANETTAKQTKPPFRSPSREVLNSIKNPDGSYRK